MLAKSRAPLAWLGRARFAPVALALLAASRPTCAAAAPSAARAAEAGAPPASSGDARPGAATASELTPSVVLLSLDGVRHDYVDRDALPAFARIQREGLRAEALVPVFPASTFPNHVSLATCAPADRHGVVANQFHDRARGDFDYDNDASWIEAEPLWAAAERQGVRSAAFFWVGSETAWDGVAASYRKAPFDAAVPETEKVDQILAWIDLPASERPRLILSWWHGADEAGHAYGPDAEETRAALAEQDRELGRLLAGLDARGAWSAATLLVVSDHGMAAAHESVDPVAALAERGIRARLWNGGGFAHLFLDDPARAAEAAAMLSERAHLDAWRGAELPPSFRYRHPTRTGDVFVLAEPPARIAGGTWWRTLYFEVASLFGHELGVHGYDPARVPEMRGILLALGRGVPAGARIGAVRSLDVAPTAARLLGIEPPRSCEGTPIPEIQPPGGS
jgi:hypothetical protein